MARHTLDLGEMRRVVIVGSYGAGKTTLAAEIGPPLGLDVHHLDALRWEPGWRLRPLDEWQAILADIVREEKWIIEGNFEQTLEPRLRRADTVIVLDFPFWLCLWRVVKRRLHGGPRHDLPPGLEERLNLRTLSLVWGYRGRPRDEILRRVSQSSPVAQVAILRDPGQVATLIGQVSASRTLSQVVPG